MQENPYGIAALWAQGDFVIKAVAVMLLLMSVASWTVIVIRVISLWRLKSISRASNDFWHAHSFAEGLRILSSADSAAGPMNPFRYMADEGQAALDHHQSHQQDLHGHLPLTEWLVSCLRGAIDESAEQMQKGLAILASVGSTAPFVGLFGTVWGIYHALVGIGVSGQASIDKVAGPVGEALIMTAFGLAVAIPAVLGYNALQRGNKEVLNKMQRFAHQLHAYFLTGAAPKSSRVVVPLKEAK
ncbi:biopolymer transport protein [Rheinheimera sp. A13L]|uniref:MotA/TolQ/ExbB proton channel family protein n=1 Tax=Rheinheimera sp. A13L TaxID=506534 RepID=UPI00021249F6|nr:MotA/TolQ/ExbB proton channel family protein [Rheinheimera sp. A13L]EGM78987.1 biopolymer transport protein [Rheinheimera sp. A13L]